MQWQVALFLFPVNAVCIFFLLVRAGVAIWLLDKVLSQLRHSHKWRYGKLGEDFASETILNAHFIASKGWQPKVRLGVAAVWFVLALAVARLSPFLPCALVLLCCMRDGFAVLLSASPTAELNWTADRHGVKCGLQKSFHEKHVIIPGGISLSGYACGVLEFAFKRYGAEQFQDCDFTGASSGSWAAAAAVFASERFGSVHDVFEMFFLTAAKITDLFPFGLLFIGCDCVSELVAWAMRTAQVQCVPAFDAIAQRSRLAIWLFGFSIRSQAYRIVVRRGEDVKDPSSCGALIAATSVFPYFTAPRLCSSLHCMQAAMDGYFPGKGMNFLPVPDLTLSCAGKVIILDISGVKTAYAGMDRIHVVDLIGWGNFSSSDYVTSSPEGMQSLFVRGLKDAAEHVEELDDVMWRAFGCKPL